MGHTSGNIQIVLMNTERVDAVKVDGNFNRNIQRAQQWFIARWGKEAKQDSITKQNSKPVSLLLFLPSTSEVLYDEEPQW